MLLIERVPKARISFYAGQFVICAPAASFLVGAIKAFNADSGAPGYWEGNSKKQVLQRIYGTAFTKKPS